ncbi:MAG: flagellar hook-basal body complex protein FliE [Gammaproteobacteria bacterium]
MSANTINPETLLVQMRAMAAQAQARAINPTTETSGPDFATLLKNSVNSVNSTQQESAKLSEAFTRGDPNVQMSEVMVALEKSSVSFQAMLEVRNKLVQAYQEIMNMQV